MPTYKQQLEALHRAVIHKDFGEMEAFTKLARHNQISATERINVYAKGYNARLMQATKGDYPTLAHFIGTDTLDEEIKRFTHAVASPMWDLNLYPALFADFFKKTNHSTTAKALCHLEAAISEVYWQPQSPALKPDALATLDEEAFGNLRFKLRTSAKLLTLKANAEDYLSSFREEKPLATMHEGIYYVLVLRADKAVMRYVMEHDEFKILSALHNERTMNDALASVKDQTSLEAKLPTYLSCWFERGVFSESF